MCINVYTQAQTPPLEASLKIRIMVYSAKL